MIISRRVMVVIVFLVVISLFLAYLSLMSIFVPRSNDWTWKATQIDILHDLGFDGSDVIIGIVDTGLDVSHQEFDISSFLAWKDFVNQKIEYYDDDDHGTHIGGLLVSKVTFQGLFSGINMQGIACNAGLVVAKSISRNQYIYGGGNDSTIADGIGFCMDNGADIILLSMGMSPEDLDFEDNSKTIGIINQAIQNGIFVVMPAGNDGEDDDGDVCPLAVSDMVISVGAVSEGNAVSSFSSKGHQYPRTIDPYKKPELVAPGEEIMSTRINGAYGELSGTSQAAAYVAGILALLLEAYPEYKHDGVENENETTIYLFKEVLAKTARKIGSLEDNDEMYSHDDYYGYGLIQAYDAYQELGTY